MLRLNVLPSQSSGEEFIWLHSKWNSVGRTVSLAVCLPFYVEWYEMAGKSNVHLWILYKLFSSVQKVCRNVLEFEIAAIFEFYLRLWK